MLVFSLPKYAVVARVQDKRNKLDSSAVIGGRPRKEHQLQFLKNTTYSMQYSASSPDHLPIHHVLSHGPDWKCYVAWKRLYRG